MLCGNKFIVYKYMYLFALMFVINKHNNIIMCVIVDIIIIIIGVAH